MIQPSPTRRSISFPDLSTASCSDRLSAVSLPAAQAAVFSLPDRSRS
jgi:hypothetical protein